MRYLLFYILPSSFQVALARLRKKGKGEKRGNSCNQKNRFQLRECMLMHTRLIDNCCITLAERLEYIQLATIGILYLHVREHVPL